MKVALPPVDVEPFRVDDPARNDPDRDDPDRDDARDEPAGDDPAEALIREAKQRARRRRLRYGGAAVLVAIAAVAAFMTFRSDTPPPQTTTPAMAPRPAVPLGAPLVVGPDAASTLVASYGEVHFGYVFVYADGRVVFLPDIGAGVFEEFEYAVLERHLSPHGLELVRDGQIAPKEILAWGRPSTYSREELWAEPTARLYEPSAYAICYFTPGPFLPTHAVSVASLPSAVQPLLDGNLRTYDPSVAFVNPEMDAFNSTSDGTPLGPMDCFELTAAEEAALYQLLDANGWIPHPPDQPEAPIRLDWYGWAGGPIYVMPIYPHGQPVLWGG
jgi:hypothetical protein